MSKYVCTSCSEEIIPVFEQFPFQDDKLWQIDNGLSFDIFGGYGEFFDTIGEKDRLKISLCHSCAVKVMKIVDPNLTQKGGHYTINSDGSRCCEWCFTDKDIDKTIEEHLREEC